MATTAVTIKIDAELKASAQELARSAGLTLSSLVNSYLRQVVATRRIEIYAPEPMTPHLEGLIAQLEADIANGEVSQTFTSVQDLIEDLEK